MFDRRLTIVWAFVLTAWALAASSAQAAGPPVIQEEFVTNVAATSATLNARLNGEESDTTYHFEYGATSSYGSQTPEEDAGSGAVSVQVHLQNLEPGTVYHYRLLASNVDGTVEGADHTFETQVAGGELTLLDGRSWELVSPANKAAGLIGVFTTGTQAASDGRAITYKDRGTPIGEGAAAGSGADTGQILSARGPNGWRSEDIMPPQDLPSAESEESEGSSAQKLLDDEPGYGIFSENLSLAALDGPPLFTSLSPGALGETEYLRNNESGSFVPLLTTTNTPSGAKTNTPSGAKLSDGVFFLDTTPDLSHVILGSSLALTPEAVAGVHIPDTAEPLTNLYEWSGGRLQLINILPGGEPTVPEAAELSLAGGGRGLGSTGRAVSTDGRWVAWTRGNTYFNNLPYFQGLYVRDMVNNETFQVGGGSAAYQTMSSDGSRVFYLEGGDLHEFNTGTKLQTDLTPGHGAGESSAGVQEIVSDASEDGTYVYFVATGVLASGASSGENNLYLLHEAGGDWSIRYIATLSPEDEKSWYGEIGNGTPFLPAVTSRVSPDGRYLAFMSQRPLTGYDNTDATSGQPDEEVYLYDATTAHLICASCNPTGSRPVGVGDPMEGSSPLVDLRGTWRGHWLAGSIPGWGEDGSESVYQPRYLSDSGRLFFDSPEALVPQDTNGLEDAYEYEPAGTGSCARGEPTFHETYSGCVDLVSSGQASGESEFFDASETGDDVFFITNARLTASDYDTAYDVYDARVCSQAAPCLSVPASPPPCDSGDSCKSAPSPQPEIFGPAPSETFSGAGNPIAPGPAAVTPRLLTRSQKLARALRACQKKKRHAARAACERTARRRYGARSSHRAKATRKGGR